MSVTATIRIQQADFDVAQEIAALSKGRTDVGAVVTFSGISYHRFDRDGRVVRAAA